MIAHVDNNFNPRSLAGATLTLPYTRSVIAISIHAPSRERLSAIIPFFGILVISIHAPSRERPTTTPAGKPPPV